MSSNSQPIKELDFKPQNLISKFWPKIIWESYSINHFQDSPRHTIFYTKEEETFISVFQSCYPTLSLPELARFQSVALKYGLNLDWKSFFSAYRLPYSQEIKTLLDRLIFTPEKFQDWVSKKSLKTRELSILEEVSILDRLIPLLDWIGRIQPSYSEGYEILEIGGELVEMFNKKTDFFKTEVFIDSYKDSKNLISKLKSLRYPKTHSRDLEKNKKISQIHWPPRIRAEWVRKGKDQGHLEIRFHATSLGDLKTKIKNLSQIYGAIKDNPKSLWKN